MTVALNRQDTNYHKSNMVMQCTRRTNARTPTVDDDAPSILMNKNKRIDNNYKRKYDLQTCAMTACGHNNIFHMYPFWQVFSFVTIVPAGTQFYITTELRNFDFLAHSNCPEKHGEISHLLARYSASPLQVFAHG
ncbi:unnamed protein product [Peronospora belbahrii]|uniref:Uncharacterized protein n=1 Tax=Peronospora belbahrii TaxID=622444 RepID=A0ABN8D1W8_9STRA|nr:unnamed protein product [Peronospora belbahrii]